jgi:hypothetical protein
MRLVTQVLAVGVMCGGIVAALPERTDAAQEGGTFAPDRALTLALGRSDKAAVGTLLDAKFQWVDATGTVRTKAEALENLAAFAVSDKGMESPTELVTRDYGQVEVLRGIHNNVKFGHIWVKSLAGWRAFVYVDTAVREVPERPFTPRKPTNADSCDNPCNTTPFNEDNAATAAVKKMWMRIKTDEWKANAEDWDALTDVDHITISSTGALPKGPHVEDLAKQHAAFGSAGAGVPVISGHLADFGNVVVMTDLEGRNPAKPSAFALRMFIDRGQGWKICLSIHTEIGAGRAAEGD